MTDVTLSSTDGGPRTLRTTQRVVGGGGRYSSYRTVVTVLVVSYSDAQVAGVGTSFLLCTVAPCSGAQDTLACHVRRF